MRIEPQYIRLCLDRADYMREQYKLYAMGDGNANPKDMNEFVRICQDELGYNISLKSVPKDGQKSAIRAFYMRDEGGNYEIYVLQNLNTCWDAFVRCKELFHMLLDSEEFRRLDIYEHLKEVSLKMTVASSEPSKPVVCEVLAEISAMEFLFPFEARKREKEQGNGSINYQAIAEYYRIPRKYVEWYMSDDMMEVLGAFE